MIRSIKSRKSITVYHSILITNSYQLIIRLKNLPKDIAYSVCFRLLELSIRKLKEIMVKFTGSFHDTLEFGQVIIISGTIKKSAENFTLNLLSENNSSDIPFHMNFVFGENCQIIRNTKINGEFGAAENTPGMFTKEKNPLRSGEVD